jgi:hypothetical protein
MEKPLVHRSFLGIQLLLLLCKCNIYSTRRLPMRASTFAMAKARHEPHHALYDPQIIRESQQLISKISNLCEVLRKVAFTCKMHC